MASNPLFISVVSPPSTSGNIVFHIKTRTFSPSNNNPPTDALTGSSGIPEGLNIPDSADFTYTQAVVGNEDEEDLAIKIATGLGAYLIANSLNYQGWLAYTEEVYPATFQVTSTDQCVCVWSQTLFKIDVTANNTGAKLTINKSPNWLTLKGIKEMSPEVNFGMTFQNGTPMTDDQLISAALTNSSFLSTRTQE